MKLKYFAYGSNMDPERMRRRGIKFSRREHAVLEGFRLEFNKVSSRNPREGYANIVKDPEGIVEGILYEIEESDLSKLDKFEGYPLHYRRTRIYVKLDNGDKVEAGQALTEGTLNPHTILKIKGSSTFTNLPST